ncbi:MAG: N-methyl-L-tryptophan oxidase [Microcystaceae cyanobacterium]
MMNNFDVIIIGAGAMGSAATYYLTQKKQKVLVLEQFNLDHQKGSSYGISRVIRYTYENPIYVNLMKKTYPLWFELEERSKENLYVKTGELDFGFPDNPTLQELEVSMKQSNLPYDKLTSSDIKKRFPDFNIPSEMMGLHQADTGYLKASRCVLTHLQLAEKQGGTILDNTPVTDIKVKKNSVEVITPQETYQSEKLIITTGSWSNSLLSQLGLTLPLKIMVCQLAFFQRQRQVSFNQDKFPIFLACLTGKYGEYPYGIPTADPNIVKFSTFYGWETVDSINEVDYTPSVEWVEEFREFLQQYLPNCNGELKDIRRCLYTLTPNKDFIIDHHPEFNHIWIATGFSGHGFKFSTLVGKILANLIVEGKTDCDLSLFTI